MNNKKVAMLYSKINGIETIRIYSGEKKSSHNRRQISCRVHSGN